MRDAVVHTAGDNAPRSLSMEQKITDRITTSIGGHYRSNILEQ